MTQHNFDHEIHCATEAHRHGNKPACRHHLLQAIELLDAPQHQCLRDLTIGTKVQTPDAQVYQVIKHEPEVRRVKLRLLTAGNHQKWDAPEDTRVEWRATGHCEIWETVESPQCTCGTRISQHHSDGCPSAAPSPFAFADALSIMERGGECEHWWGGIGWLKSRIVEGERQYLRPVHPQEWTCDLSDWTRLNWRPCNPEAQR